MLAQPAPEGAAGAGAAKPLAAATASGGPPSPSKWSSATGVSGGGGGAVFGAPHHAFAACPHAHAAAADVSLDTSCKEVRERIRCARAGGAGGVPSPPSRSRQMKPFKKEGGGVSKKNKRGPPAASARAIPWFERRGDGAEGFEVPPARARDASAGVGGAMGVVVAVREGEQQRPSVSPPSPSSPSARPPLTDGPPRALIAGTGKRDAIAAARAAVDSGFARRTEPRAEASVARAPPLPLARNAAAPRRCEAR